MNDMYGCTHQKNKNSAERDLSVNQVIRAKKRAFGWDCMGYPGGGIEVLKKISRVAGGLANLKENCWRLMV